MKTRVKTALADTKNYVKTHKGAICLGVVATAAIALQQMNLKDFYKFLEAKGIDPMEYYAPEAYAELNQ